MNNSQKPVNKGGKLVLAILLLIFTLPFAAAWFIYNFTGMGKDAGPNSYGELIVPPVPLLDMKLLDPAMSASSYRLHGKWSLLYVSSDQCARECEEQLEAVTGVRLGLGNDAARTQAILVLTGAGSGEELKVRLGRMRILLIETLIEPDLSGASVNGVVLQQGRLYLTDPLGNLMMSYPSDSDPAGIIRDMKRLLRYSRIG